MATHTAAYHRQWKQGLRTRPNPRPSTAKYRCIDCNVEVCKCALRCTACGGRNRAARKA